MANPTKCCTKCGTEFPATTDYFQRDSHKKSGLRSTCKPCAQEACRLYKAANADKVNEALRRYRETHKEQMRERDRRYYYANPEKVHNKSRRWRAANAQNVREYNKRYYELDAEKHRDRTRTYRQENPEKTRAQRHRRRARILAAEGTHTAADIQAQLKRQQSRCYYCGVKLGTYYHVDHVHPLVRGGWNDPSNLVIACEHCNESKGKKLPHEWPEGGRLL